MPHQVEICAVVAGYVLCAVRKLLAAGEQLFQIAEATRHGLATRIDDLRVWQHEMDKPNMAKVIEHLIDKQPLAPAVGARVSQVALAEPSPVFRGKMRKQGRITRIFRI